MSRLLATYVVLQTLAAVRTYGRTLRGVADGIRLSPSAVAASPGLVSVVVPVLDEAARLGACLDGLVRASAAVREILVVDGGSTDGTADLVRSYAARDPRVRLVDAGPPPDGWNGKAWNLDRGVRASAPVRWILTLDADVRPAPDLAEALIAHAATTGCDAFSAAPLQVVRDPLLAALHPALLATLVLRWGTPGRVTGDARHVSANGQCFFVLRDLLVATDAIAHARASRCEDVTIARRLAADGVPVGFFEAPLVASVEMYRDAREALANWPRSLLLRDDATSSLRIALGLFELALVQAAPLPVALALARGGRAGTAVRAARLAALALLAARLGLHVGTRRAYADVPATYWLAPLLDPVAVAALAREFVAPTARWRGRALTGEGGRS